MMKSRSIGWATLSLATLFGLSIAAIADESAVAPPLEVTKLVTNILPGSWICESEATRLVVRPRKEPVFVNLVSAGRQQRNESLDEYHRRHTVRFDYRIALRFEPTLSPDRVQQIVKESQAIHQRLQTIERSPLVEQMKGDVYFPQTLEGQALSKEYDQLKSSIRPIPDGYIGKVSVFVEPTDLGYARFLHKETEQECEAVKKQLADQLTP